ncbi:unnamed protein product, partial [Laminaria digitata]
MISHFIFKTMPVLVCSAQNLLSRVPPISRDRASVQRPTHTAALGDPGEITSANAQLGERGAWEGVIPGKVAPSPGRRGIIKKLETPNPQCSKHNPHNCCVL